jgi:hypothetical protein
VIIKAKQEGYVTWQLKLSEAVHLPLEYEIICSFEEGQI